MSATNQELIIWGLSAAIDRYYQIVRRRICLPDTLEASEQVQGLPTEELFKLLTDAEIYRCKEYMRLYERLSKRSEVNDGNTCRIQ